MPCETVKVRLRPGRRGEDAPRGHVVEIIERETSQFVGVYLERDGQALVQIDGALIAEPIPVGDPGAKNAVEGDKVVVADIGANTFALWSRPCSRSFPKVIGYSQARSQIEVIKRRENARTATLLWG